MIYTAVYCTEVTCKGTLKRIIGIRLGDTPDNWGQIAKTYQQKRIFTEYYSAHISSLEISGDLWRYIWFSFILDLNWINIGIKSETYSNQIT